jgi:hypothetical protein
MALALALLATLATQGPLLAADRAWVSIHVVDEDAPKSELRTPNESTPEIDWRVWRPLGFDEQGPYGRLARYDVVHVSRDRWLHLVVARDEFVEVVAYGPNHGIAELRIAPDTTRSAVRRPRDRSFELEAPLAGDERGRVELDITQDGTALWFEPTNYKLLELSPTGGFCIRVAGFDYRDGAPGLGNAALALSAGRHRLAVGEPGQMCGVGPAMPNWMVLPRATLDVRPGVVSRWSPVLTRGTSVELRVDCPDITLPPLPRPTDDDEWFRWQAPMDEDDLVHWCAARLVSRDTGEVHEPSWGWNLQTWANDSAIFPLGVDAYTIERFPAGTYTLEVRGPGISLLTQEVELTAPEMEKLDLTASPR